MKKRSRILSAICAAALLVTATTACSTAPASSGAAESTMESKTESTASSTAAATGDAPTLIYWTVGQQPENLPEGLEKINAYLMEKINVKLDAKIASWGDWETKMNTIVNSGEKFDLMFTNSGKYSSQVNMNAFADITDDIATVTPELQKLIPQAVWDGAKLGGRLYAVPTYKDSSLTQYWMLDDTYVQKYSIDTSKIKTFADLDPVLRKIKEGEGKNCYPALLSQGSTFNGFSNEYDDLATGLPTLGVRFDDNSRKVVSVLEQPEMMERLKMLHQWYVDGLVNPDAPTLTEPPKGAIFGTAQGFPGAEVAWAINAGIAKYDAFQVFGPLYTTGTIQGSMNAISKNSENKEAALKFLQLANTDHKLRDMLAFGVEGKDFEYQSENVIKKLTDTWTWPAYTQATFFNLSTLSDAPADQYEQVKKLNDTATNSSCLGFALDITNLNNEMANCKTTWDKYKFELMTGASDPEKIMPQLMDEMKASGFDT
ncbi:MAG: ABC transporter substrate-binding protein, partial [Oscillospiraceae bacterium]